MMIMMERRISRNLSDVLERQRRGGGAGVGTVMKGL